MIWVLVGVLALAALVVAHLGLRLPRSSMMLFASALLFGLAGYALQGSPAQPASPSLTRVVAAEDGEALVAARRELFDTGQQPARYIVVADAFARRGQYADAAQMLRGAVAEQPGNAEAWVALGNALVEHAGGQLTPAAIEAFGRAEAARPDHPGAGYFLGIALIRSGRIDEARDLWAQMLAATPADAPWRAALADRLARLDAMIGQMAAQAADQAPD